MLTAMGEALEARIFEDLADADFGSAGNTLDELVERMACNAFELVLPMPGDPDDAGPVDTACGRATEDASTFLCAALRRTISVFLADRVATFAAAHDLAIVDERTEPDNPDNIVNLFAWLEASVETARSRTPAR